MTVGKHVPAALLARIRKVARDNPELSHRDLAERFGLSQPAIIRALQNEALPPELRFPVGTSVKVSVGDGRRSRLRTGVVVDDALKFPWRDHRRIEFDPDPGQVSSALVPVENLRVIKPSERPESARPREQADLFGGAA